MYTPTIASLSLLILSITSLSSSTALAQTNTTSNRDNSAPLRDTLYILDSTYIEIRIDEQMIYQHFSNDSIYIYPCSTGNPELPKGIATREGIFSIKGKAQEYRSSKFDVPMYYWMPFDGGIGIHALAGDAYYWDLGSEISSHGCVRVSREAGKEIYQNSPVGTVVYVHGDAPARVLAFADSTVRPLRIMKSVESKLLGRRLDAVMSRRASDPSLKAKLALPRGKTFTGGIGVGKITLERSPQAEENPTSKSVLPSSTQP